MQNARLAQEQMRDEQQMLEPVASDGSMDNDGRTPDPNSGIESHDGADTDSRTASWMRSRPEGLHHRSQAP